MPSTPEIALWGGTVPSATPRPVDVERTVSPPRRKPDPNAPTETMPAVISQRTRDFTYVGREIGIFAILCAIFYWVLLPQNAQSIKNQEALQAANVSLNQTNAKWADIMEKQVANEGRFAPTLEALTVEIRGLRSEVRELKIR